MEKKCETCRFYGRQQLCPAGEPSCNSTNKYYKWQPKEEPMKYRVLKEISPTTLGNHSTSCGDFWREFYSLMGVFDGGWFRACPSVDIHPVFDRIIKWAEEDPKRIAWLIEKGFIEKVEPELKPCPFCGCGAEEQDGWSGLYIQCKKCFATAGKEAWNRRA